MSRLIFRLCFLIPLLIALFVAGHSPVHSDSSATRVKPAFDASYRSHTSTHKVIVNEDQPELRDSILSRGGELLEDYGGFALLSAPEDVTGEVSVQSRTGSSVRDDMNMVLLRASQFDTTQGEPLSAYSLGSAAPAQRQLYLVQMIGPIKREWRQALSNEDVDVVSYIPNNTYLVNATSDGFKKLNAFKSRPHSFVQWLGDYKPVYKIAPEISLDFDQEILATVELIAGESSSEVDQMVASGQARKIGKPARLNGVTDVRVRIRTSKIADVARLANVMWIEPWSRPELMDEKQDQIVAGNYSGDVVGGPNYLGWLQSKGLTTTPDFLVDVADSGLDRGSLDPQVIHKDFLNVAGVNRVQYARFNGADGTFGNAEDVSGHGTLNAAIVGGYNAGDLFPDVDPEGFHFGLGVHPFVKLGATRIFAPSYTNPDFQLMLSDMYRDGARVSSNSWGAYNNLYNSDCKFYDALVRDAQVLVSGRQEMNIVFSAGNKGPGGNLTVPGNAKNVITVGASENVRPGVDGCQIDSSGADTINSIASFSSGGPSDDGRVKPDLVAPGTHIQGAQSQSPNFTGAGVCGPINFPAGQTLYTWSSGTSHSAPAVAGGVALVRQYFEQSTGKIPSPAMVKALLLNATTYVSGTGGGDNLPGNQQGWGLMDLGKTLDGVPRLIVDQDEVFTSSGEIATFTGTVASAAVPLRVTLAWTDAPGNPPAFGPSVNDLDLSVEIGGKVYLGNHFNGDVSVEGGSFDKKNNVESVWLPAGTEGDFVIHVSAANITGDGVPFNGPSTTDQDFALVIYNAQAQSGGGGGGGNPVDAPPSVSLVYPAGGEKVLVGSIMHITWNASDDNGIQSQRVEFSSDGATFNQIAALDGSARSFDWHVPAIPTPFGTIRVTALDGVNLPVAVYNINPFEIDQGPPDLVPPTVSLQSPNGDSIVGGGQILAVKWTESDNVGVTQRTIELSTDNGDTFQQIVSLTAPSSGDQQSYDWQVPAEMSTQKGRLRVTVFDGAGNNATVTSGGKFEVWPMGVITSVDYNFAAVNGKDQLELSGRNFRDHGTVILVDGVQLKKIKYNDKFLTGNGTCRKVFSIDKKLPKRIPPKTDVNIQVMFTTTGQTSAAFSFRHGRPPTP
jgi:subtilisin family serine protease